MTLAKASDLSLFRPLEGAVIRRFTAGTGGVAAGDVVTIGADGVVPTDGNDATYKRSIGVAIKTAAAGDVVAIVTHGPITGFTGGTIGARVYPDDTTPGLAIESASTNKHSIGVLWVSVPR